MSWMERVEGLLKQYSDPATAPQPAPQVNTHFDKVAGAAPTSTLAEALASLFRSGEAGTFSEAVSKLFAQSNNEQKNGLLSRLLSGGDAQTVSRILAAAGLEKSASSGQLTPGQSARVTPQTVRDLAGHAQEHDPSIVDEVSRFYAQHPALVKTLGVSVVSGLLAKVAKGRV